MPKSFSDNERIYIKNRLMEEARLCLSQFGIRKTTVDALVKKVNIPKGTFYLFYNSKELLFFDVICDFHDEIHQKLLTEIAILRKDVSPQKLTELIFDIYKMTTNSFMSRILTEGEMDLLIRKLPPEILKSHTEKDDFSIEQLFSLAPNMKSTDIKAFSAAFRGIFLTMLNKHAIGDDVFDDALRIMISGVVLQMFEGEEK